MHVPDGIKCKLPRGAPHHPDQFILFQLEPAHDAGAPRNVPAAGRADFLFAVLGLNRRRLRLGHRSRLDGADNVGLAAHPGQRNLFFGRKRP